MSYDQAWRKYYSKTVRDLAGWSLLALRETLLGTLLGAASATVVELLRRQATTFDPARPEVAVAGSVRERLRQIYLTAMPKSQAGLHCTIAGPTCGLAAIRQTAADLTGMAVGVSSYAKNGACLTLRSRLGLKAAAIARTLQSSVSTTMAIMSPATAGGPLDRNRRLIAAAAGGTKNRKSFSLTFGGIA